MSLSLFAPSSSTSFLSPVLLLTSFLSQEAARALKAAVVLSTLLVSQLAYAAPVVELSAEDFAQYGQEDAYWIVSVTCQGSDVENIIQRKTDGSRWCAKDDAQRCNDSKNQTAKMVCADDYLAQLNSIKQNEASRQRDEARRLQASREEASRVEARRIEAQRALTASLVAEPARKIDPVLQNKISIEEQRLSIEQERLELRRRELELERRKVELEEQLENMG